MEAARFWTMARRWWWLILVGALMTTAAYAVAEPVRERREGTPAYTASAALFVSLYDQQDSAEEIAARTGGDAWTIDRLLNSYATMLEGEAIAQAVADGLSIDVAGADLRNAIDADAVPHSQLVRLTTTAGSPADAERLRDAVLHAFTKVRGTAGVPGEAYVYEINPARLDEVSPRSELTTFVVIALAGMLAAAGIVFAFEYLSDTIRDSGDAERVTGLTALTTLPIWRAGRHSLAFDARDRISREAAERYRLLRSALGASRASVIAVTAPVTGTGTTTTALNLAVAIARSGRPTLLLEANLRTPTLDRRLALQPRSTLADALRDASAPDPVRATRVEGLSAIAGGAAPDSAAELIESDRFAALLAQWRARFDTVVIDCPAVLTATETLAIARLADTAAIVVRTDKTARPEAAAAVELLRRAKADVAGIVVNADPGAGPAAFAPRTTERTPDAITRHRAA